MASKTPQQPAPTRPHLAIEHLATGGTIDSHWAPEKDTAIPNAASIIRGYLENARLTDTEITSRSLTMKDSQHINLSDQDGIAAAVAETPEKRVIVTSGTYLMPDIAGAIEHHPATKHFERIGKRVIVTGALVPIRDYVRSDGGFNLGMAVAACRRTDMGNGVLITMNGMVFDTKKGVRKDLVGAKFGSDSGQDILNYTGFTLIPVGGSIDFIPDGLDGLKPLKRSCVPAFLRETVNLQRKFNVNTPFIRDSRDLNKEDLDTITEIVRTDTSGHVLITAGTYKMGEVRAHLEKSLTGETDKERRVLITGSRFPLQHEGTDASFNLGFALGSMDAVEPGVHNTISGVILHKSEDPIRLAYTDAEIKILKGKGTI